MRTVSGTRAEGAAMNYYVINEGRAYGSTTLEQARLLCEALMELGEEAILVSR
jgi:hypothetical protein